MSHYYLTQWVGTGTDLDAFHPDLGFATGAEWQVIDLRLDGSQQTGFAIVWTNLVAASVPSSATYLGDGSFAALPNNIRNRLRNALSLEFLNGATIPEILAELLTTHARTDGTRWKPLRPRRTRGAFGQPVDRFEIHLGGVIRQWDEAVG